MIIRIENETLNKGIDPKHGKFPNCDIEIDMEMKDGTHIITFIPYKSICTVSWYAHDVVQMQAKKGKKLDIDQIQDFVDAIEKMYGNIGIEFTNSTIRLVNNDGV